MVHFNLTGLDWKNNLYAITSKYYDLPKIVIEGLSRPSLLKSAGLSIFANGLFGSGSLGVPSTLAQQPIEELLPTKNNEIKIFF